MNKLLKCLICIILLKMVTSSEDILFQSYIQFCDWPELDLQGTCLPVTDCATVKENRSKFKICGWNGNIPNVCCIFSAGTKNFNVFKGSVLSTTPNPISKTVNPIGKRPSIAKCEEYREFLNPRAFSSGGDEAPSISGGENADFGEFPHMALIGWTLANNKTEWNCGGSIISENFILTAAHCHLKDNVEAGKVRIGEYDLRSDDASAHEKEASIKQFIKHPDYRRLSVYNDIALIEIVGYIKFKPNVRPACLHQATNAVVQKVLATGWGQIEFSGVTASILQKVELEYFNKTSCEPFYPSSRRLSNGIVANQICYGDSQGLKGDTCQGDSGGPIQIVQTVQYNAKFYDIVGVTSTGTICGFNAPGIYTNVAAYIDWIESIVWPSSDSILF